MDVITLTIAPEDVAAFWAQYEGEAFKPCHECGGHTCGLVLHGPADAVDEVPAVFIERAWVVGYLECVTA